jgi:hypothetical protein
MRRLSWGCVRRVAKLRFTSPSMRVDIEGNVNPMCSATSDSEDPLFLLRKPRTRNCGTESSWAPCLLNSPRMVRITSGTVSMTSRVHSSIEVCNASSPKYFDLPIVRKPKYLAVAASSQQTGPSFRSLKRGGIRFHVRGADWTTLLFWFQQEKTNSR